MTSTSAVESHFEPRVVRLAIHVVVGEDGARSRLPRFVARDGLFGSVGKLELELDARLDGTGAVDGAAGQRADLSGEPTVAHDDAESVVAHREHRGHVVGLVLEPLSVVGPAGREVVDADALSVQRKLIEAERRRVDARALHGLRDVEGLAKVRRRSPAAGARGGRRPR
jgi:hypothetical protein